MKRLLSQIIAAGLGLWLASMFVLGVKAISYPNSSFLGLSIDTTWKIFILLGIIIGLINHFVKPVLNAVTLPLRIITLGFVGLLINMGMIWIVDIMFEELYIPLWLPLLYTSLIIWGLNIIITKLISNEE